MDTASPPLPITHMPQNRRAQDRRGAECKTHTHARARTLSLTHVHAHTRTHAHSHKHDLSHDMHLHITSTHRPGSYSKTKHARVDAGYKAAHLPALIGLEAPLQCLLCVVSLRGGGSYGLPACLPVTCLRQCIQPFWGRIVRWIMCVRKGRERNVFNSGRGRSRAPPLRGDRRAQAV